MPLHEITAKTILRKFKKIDSWSLSRYGITLYRGCAYNCAYCDGRTETYRVTGSFGDDIAVKVNALHLLQRELDPARRRKPLKSGYIVIGGGVGDSYQPAEKRYHLTQDALALVHEYGFGVHLMTKSALQQHEREKIVAAHTQYGALVSFSFSSMNPKISAIFEPHAAAPAKRLQTLSALREQGVPAGSFLMPLIPFITDTLPELERTFQALKNAGAAYICFGEMTLKEGQQKDYFMQILTQHYPHLVAEYASIYHKDRWGQPAAHYTQSLNETLAWLGKKYRIPLRIPIALTKQRLSMQDRVVAILGQLDYLVQLEGVRSPYRKAAYAISQLTEPCEDWRGRLKQIQGIGPVTERLIREILDTGTAGYYKRLLYYQ